MIRPHVFLILFVLFLALVLFLRPREQELRIEAIPAQAGIWTDEKPPPVALCPTPHHFPICRGEGCPKPRSIA